MALVRPADLKYYTTTSDFTDIRVVGQGRAAFPQQNHWPAGTEGAAGNGPGSNGGAPAASAGGDDGAAAVCCRGAECAAAAVTTRWLGFMRIWQGSNKGARLAVCGPEPLSFLHPTHPLVAAEEPWEPSLLCLPWPSMPKP